MSRLEALRFECQRCGRCCRTRGDAGLVFLTDADEARLARFLGLTPSQLRQSHCQRIGEVLALRDGPDGEACILLGAEGCRAWRARPLQCRTWPFWPENLEGPDAFARRVGSFCPGAGRGRTWDPRKAQRVAEVQRAADRERGR